MAVADTARLIASLELKDLFSKQIGNAEKSLGRFDVKLDQTQSRAFRAGQQIGTGIKRSAAIAAGAIGFLVTQLGLGLNSLSQLETVTAQTNAVLKSTKGVAGESAQAIRNLAEKYEGLNATIDDKVIQSGENLLLTFTNIRKQAFEPTLQAALDMNTALGGGEEGLQGTIQRLGKALNDPIKGLSQLGRVGVTFTKSQQDQIKAAVKAGDTYKAQGIILAELNKRFGGSFLAGGNTTTGKIAKVKDAIEDLQKALATALLPAVSKIADATSKFLTDPQVVAQIGKLGEKIAGLFSDKNLTAGAEFLKGAFETFKEAAPFLESAAKATLGFVKAGVDVFKSLPQPLQALVAGGFALNKITGGLVTNITGGLVDLLTKARGATPANPVFVADVTGGLGGAVTKGGGILGGLGTLLKSVGIASIALGAAEVIGTAIVNAAGGPDPSGRGRVVGDVGPVQIVVGAGTQRPFQGPPIPQPLKGPLVGPAGNVTPQLSRLADELTGKLKDDSDVVRATLNVIGNEFKNIANTLKRSNKPDEIKHAIVEAEKLIGSGRGDFKSTENVLKGLQAALKKTHDPELQSALRAAIGKVERVLPGREFAAKQLAKADRILHSNENANAKIKDLQAIERAVRDRGLPAVAKTIQQKIQEQKVAQVAASVATTLAINNKKLSVTVPVSITNRVSVAETIKTQTTFKKFGSFVS